MWSSANATNHTPGIKKKVQTLRAFGGSDTLGLDVRPQLMNNEGSEIAIIGNVVAFHTCGASGQPRENRTGAMDHILIYQRTGVAPGIVAPAVRQLEDIVEHIVRKPKYRLRRKQNPAQFR